MHFIHMHVFTVFSFPLLVLSLKFGIYQINLGVGEPPRGCKTNLGVLEMINRMLKKKKYIPFAVFALIF